MIKKNYVFFLLIIVMIICLMLAIRFFKKEKFNPHQQKMVAIAKIEAEKLGYDVDRMNMLFDVNNMLWKQNYGIFADMNSTDLRDELGGKNFQSIYFGPSKKFTLGGAVWILIDKQTYDIIHVQKEK